METSKSSSAVRVLVRPPSTPRDVAASSPASARHAETPSAELAANSSGYLPAPRPASEGVAVVGFVGPEDDVTHLMNRILDANIFGAGGDKDLYSADSSSANEWEEWFRHRKIRYHHEPGRGVVFVQLSTAPVAQSWLSDGSLGENGSRLDCFLEQRDSEDLCGLLLMFSVCHVIIYLHEGARFDTNVLKKFRMLQSAKHTLAPFARAQVTLTPAHKASPSAIRPPVRTKSSASPGRSSSSRRGSAASPGRTGSSRHGSSISHTWGSGSHTSMMPGQCIPAILFVFLEDSSELQAGGEDTTSSHPHLPSSKGSNSIVMLSRPNKPESSPRKKLQTSLEAQIRFLIKKCRILSSVEPAHSVPLFSLDSSRVAVLLDRSTTRRGESLDYITSTIKMILNSRAAIDVLEGDLDSAAVEELQSVKDFISKQTDALRGRGSIPSSGSVAGGGMVAAAAAAAAASTASGKTVSAPELPSLEKWLSLSNRLLKGLLSTPSAVTGDVVGESSKGLNMSFSAAWCERALPTAKEIYMKDLPSHYPTSLHRTQVEKALDAFRRMVNGPAVKVYAKKLEEDCQSIWESGRKRCDAISLTGKPCMHQMHHAALQDRERKHSSGFVFLHACACGRSRRLRDDPFDFENANAGFSLFPECESQLPRLLLPERNHVGSLPSSSWSVVRLGGSSYYDPSKGLLQSGFRPNENFLFKWALSQENSSIMIEEVDKSEDYRMETVKGIMFGKSLPSFAMKKPFSEVVAGQTARDDREKDERLLERSDGEPFLQIGMNVVPVNMNKAKMAKAKRSPTLIIVYMGFEHECPSGHRFILSAEHLKELGSEKKSDQSDGIDVGSVGASSLLNRNLPLFMKCPRCTHLRDEEEKNYKFATGISQLQRIFLVTPPFPFVLSTCPVIQFEDSCLPSSAPNREQQSQFSPGCPIILPPTSFISLRLPFIYAARSHDGTLQPLRPSDHHPELTASLVSRTALQLVSKGVDFFDPL